MDTPYSGKSSRRRAVVRGAALTFAASLVVAFAVDSTAGGAPSGASAPAVPVSTTPAAAPAAGPAAAAAKLVPSVSGPIRTTSTSHPFGGAAFTLRPENLKKSGYVEYEYFVSGVSNVYTWTSAGPGEVRTPNAPYTTRMLIRMPANARDFSGNVWIEPMNPSNLFDLNIGWAMMNRQIVRNGDIWIGFTSKPVAMQTLKTFDPVRYAPLKMDNPLPLSDPANCTTVPSDSARTTENGLVWDMMTQISNLVRSKSASNPISYEPRKVKSDLKVYGFGYSQTGGFMYDYINAIQPLVVGATGRAAYDGYIVAVAGGAFAGAYPLNQCEAAPPVNDPRRQFSNAGTPIIHVMSQSDYLSGIASRRGDSDWPSDRFRNYEMAGAGHATPDELYYAARSEDIVRGGRAVPPMNCNEGPRSRFPSHIFFDAFGRNLDRWIRADVPPPHGSPIVVVNGAPGLDTWGNVQGGLRSPYLDVPTSTWNGTSTGASFCFIAGHEIPFDSATLAKLYPTHAFYVKQVTRSVNELVQQDFLTKYDGRELIDEARAMAIP